MITISLNLIQPRVSNEGNTTTTYAIIRDLNAANPRFKGANLATTTYAIIRDLNATENILRQGIADLESGSKTSKAMRGSNRVRIQESR